MTRTTPDVPMVRVIARRDPHLRITAVDVYYRSAGDAEFHSVGSIDPARRYPSDITVAVPDLVIAKIDAAETVEPEPANDGDLAAGEVGSSGLVILLRRAFLAGCDYSRPASAYRPTGVWEQSFAAWLEGQGIGYEPPAQVTT